MKMFDEQVWNDIEINDLWIYDKLILSKYLGHLCGPAGVDLPFPGQYIVKPITNIIGMGTGSYLKLFENTNTDHIAPGHFWMEVFKGQHLSIDIIKGKIDVTYEGISSGPSRFSKWSKIDLDIEIPKFIIDLSYKYGVVNYESIGGKIIEVHLRANPDWQKHKAKVLIPIWEGDQIPEDIVVDRSGDRIGFIVIK